MESLHKFEKSSGREPGTLKAVALAQGIDFLGPPDTHHCARAAHILRRMPNKNKDKVLLHLTSDALHILFRNETKPPRVLRRPFIQWQLFSDVMLIVTSDPLTLKSQAMFAYKLKKPRDFLRLKAEVDRKQKRLSSADIPTPKGLDRLFTPGGSDVKLPPCDVNVTSSKDRTEPEPNEHLVPGDLIDLNVNDPLEIISKEFDALALDRCRPLSSSSNTNITITSQRSRIGSSTAVLQLNPVFQDDRGFGPSDKYAPLKEAYCSEA